MFDEEMMKVLAGVNNNWPKDYIIRYLYINMAPFFQRDLNFFLATEEEKLRQYNLGFINRGDKIVCSTLADFYVNLYETFGIRSKKIIANSAQIPLFAVIVEGDYGWYYIDPLKDLFRNQYGLKPTEFGVIPYYKTLANNYPFLIQLNDDYINEIDNNIGFKNDLDDIFNMIHLEMTNRNFITDYFKLEKFDRKDLFERKLNFANEHLINIGSVNGPYERIQLYLFLEKIMFYKREKRNLRICLNCNDETFKPQIGYMDHENNNTVSYQEANDNGKFVLKKIM